VAFGSGMAAISSVLSSLMLEPGDRIVAASVLYGVTRNAFAQLAIVGIDTDYVDVANLGEVEDAVSKPDTRVLYFETISNPLLQVADVESLALIGHRHRLAVINDNTFATPYLFRPLGAGVDIVINSATKYISGHGDVTAGIAAGNRRHMKRVRDARTVNGGILSPFEAWLALRGIRTLPIRLERQCASAFEIASWLETKTWIDRVYYPGLAGHPDRFLAARQLGDRFGAMIAFDIQGEQAEALSFIDALQLITSATSLGDAVSLVLYPPLSSHRTLTPEALEKMGIKKGLIRLSVGLESPADLIRDLEQAALQSGIATSAKPLAP
jgi:cystathionine beta-lyase/cystathionine gamma-synthase